MGKGSSILAIIAIVIGLGVGTFVIYDNFIPIPPTTVDTPLRISGTIFILVVAMLQAAEYGLHYQRLL
ncbi:MAG: hypothetical protein ACFE8G_09835 [Candidatus Hermodarchaeota archaeon]